MKSLLPLPRRPAALMVMTACLSGCAVTPPYHAPSVPQPGAFKEAEGWIPAAPADILDKGPWWTLFGDAVLDELMAGVSVSNQNIAASAAAYAQARALVAEQRAQWFPQVDLGANASRSGGGGATRTAGQYRVNIGGSWEPDVWGKLGAAVSGAQASAQASEADLAAARLSVQGELAANYFSLRQADTQAALLDATVAGYEQALRIAGNRFSAGIAAHSDVLQAQTQLDNARIDRLSVRRQRAQLEHAIAVLLGKAPADFTLAPLPVTVLQPADIVPAGTMAPAASTASAVSGARAGNTANGMADGRTGPAAGATVAAANAAKPGTSARNPAGNSAGNAAGPATAATAGPATGATPFELPAIAVPPLPPVPEIPASLPSTLLQRRPDIAAAERRVAAANAQVGVARAAYFPSLNLSASFGVGASQAAGLFSASNTLWSLGLAAAQTLFDAGATRARVAGAEASRDAAVARYRQAVLAAFADVEDQLAASRVLEQQQALRRSASASADAVERQMVNRYRAGQVAYTDVVQAQVTALSARRALAQAQADRQAVAVALIQSLGGGWRAGR